MRKVDARRCAGKPAAGDRQSSAVWVSAPVCLALQAALYVYYALTAMGLRISSPPLALMTSQEASLTGALRAAHQVG